MLSLNPEAGTVDPVTMRDPRCRRDPGPPYRALSTLLLLTALVLPSVGRAADLRSFAECLAESGTVFYSAHWCPYCARQRADFGGFAHLLNTIECSEPGSRKTNATCRREGIKRYPTWEFPNGERRTGLLSLETLARVSGCSLGS